MILSACCNLTKSFLSEIDTDSDAVFDCLDQCPIDSNKAAAGACGCGFVDNNNGLNVFNCSGNQYLEDNTEVSEPPRVEIAFDGTGKAILGGVLFV